MTERDNMKGRLQQELGRDSARGNRFAERQRDIHFRENTIGNTIEGRIQLRPGWWRLLPLYQNAPTMGPEAVWFRLGEQVSWLPNPPVGPPVAGCRANGAFTEPMTPFVPRQVFVDGDAVLYYCIPVECAFVAVLLSEADDLGVR